jgi:plasmid stabilization system protein ParE
MGEEALRVEFTEDALTDLDELSDYWSARGEAWRAEKYHRDLMHRAELELSSATAARRGRPSRIRKSPEAREILAFGIYRIIYRIDEAAGIVRVLRFWHAHRNDPPPA